jgi:hypothetical protein
MAEEKKKKSREEIHKGLTEAIMALIMWIKNGGRPSEQGHKND